MTLTKGGNTSHSYEIYFSYKSTGEKQINSWDVTSENEYNSVNLGDSILIIYSIKKPEIIDIIIDNKEKEIYKTIINNKNNYR
jgi:hypothetical protein